MKALLASLLLLCSLPAFSADEKAAPKPPAVSSPIRELSVDETERFIHDHKGTFILDVRTAEEYHEEGHLQGAKLLDFFHPQFEQAVKDIGLDKSKPVIVYCAIGGRAKRAADKLVKLGFSEVILPKGSFNGWKAAGKKVEK
jgi:rhodanese-related sulfurtransferase